MKKIVTLSLIAAASLAFASCTKKTEVVANDTNVTDTNVVAADTMADTNAVVDSNSVAPMMDNASNAM